MGGCDHVMQGLLLSDKHAIRKALESKSFEGYMDTRRSQDCFIHFKTVKSHHDLKQCQVLEPGVPLIPVVITSKHSIPGGKP
jgi:hypothetical protein